jgi:cell division protein FtsB
MSGVLRAIRRPLQGRAITGRMLVLAGVVVLLVVLLAAPLHRYLSARSAENQAVHQQQQDKASLAQLQKQAAQLSDPEYIESQARARLQYAMPGETVYGVVRPGSQPKLDDSAPAASGPTHLPGQTWNQRLWGSVVSADGSK